jgi:hypothetical protein
MPVFEHAAKATLCIECGDSRGSGFHFLRPDIVITNCHVILDKDGRIGRVIRGITEGGEQSRLNVLASSPPNQDDYAILQTADDLPTGRAALRPKSLDPVSRGQPVLFAGFPHGISHLLVQSAAISGVLDDKAFYIDGSVNGGNSGGPIVDASEGSVVGVVTERRFLGAPYLYQLAREAERLRTHCESMARLGSVEIMGINFGEFGKLMAEAMLLMREVLEANANTGIGIGYSIRFVSDECARLGLAAPPA